ncbi:hypothetical protein BUN20_00075 [Bacteroides fragilis]|nr:hypothetical protein BUN20_00075 [Bacteroides fragilis]
MKPLPDIWKNSLRKKYQLSDIALNNLEANFISKFDAFLKIEKGCAQNSSITRLKNLKKNYPHCFGKRLDKEDRSLTIALSWKKLILNS